MVISICYSIHLVRRPAFIWKSHRESGTTIIIASASFHLRCVALCIHMSVHLICTVQPVEWWTYKNTMPNGMYLFETIQTGVSNYSFWPSFAASMAKCSWYHVLFAARWQHVCTISFTFSIKHCLTLSFSWAHKIVKNACQVTFFLTTPGKVH